jgi:hypothetical protein
MELVNTNLLRNPLNWATVLFMLLIFAMFADVVLAHYSQLLATLNPNPVATRDA